MDILSTQEKKLSVVENKNYDKVLYILLSGRKEEYPDQKCLEISSLQTDCLNLDNSLSGSIINTEKSSSAKAKCTYCGLNNHSVEKCFKKIRK